MILAEDNRAVPLPYHQHRRLVMEEEEEEEERRRELVNEEMDREGIGGDGCEGEGIDDEIRAMELGSPILRKLLPQCKSVVVGYALTTKKVKSFLQPKLEYLAR